jgi:hypothetical protein
VIPLPDGGVEAKTARVGKGPLGVEICRMRICTYQGEGVGVKPGKKCRKLRL